MGIGLGCFPPADVKNGAQIVAGGWVLCVSPKEVAQSC